MNTIAAQRQDISRFIAGAAQAAEDAWRAAAHLDPVLGRLGNGADAVEKMAKEMNFATGDARKIFAEVSSGVHQFTGETLPETGRLLTELNVLVVSLGA